MAYEMIKGFDNAEKAWRYKPSGDIDIHTSNGFQNEVLRDFKEKPADIVIDAADLIYLDSTGLGAIIAIYNEISKEGFSISFENVRKFVRKLLNITDMDKLFNIRSELDE